MWFSTTAQKNKKNVTDNKKNFVIIDTITIYLEDIMKKTILKAGVVAASLLFSVSSFAGGTCDLTNIAAWSANQNPANLLSVSDQAAHDNTSCGLQLEVAEQQGGAARHWVQDDSPNGELRYRVSFCFNPNNIELPSTGPERRLKVHIASCGSPAGPNSCFGFDNLMLKFDNTNANAATPDYRIIGYVRDNNIAGAAKRNVFNFPVPDAPFRLEYDLLFGANDTGHLKMWIDAENETDPRILELTGLDLDPAIFKGIFLTRIGQMGVHESIAAGQEYYFDEFESRRQTFIGGGACPHTPPAP